MMTQVEKEFLLFQEWAATEFKFAHRVAIPQCTYMCLSVPFVREQCHAEMQYTHIYALIQTPQTVMIAGSQGAYRALSYSHTQLAVFFHEH